MLAAKRTLDRIKDGGKIRNYFNSFQNQVREITIYDLSSVVDTEEEEERGRE
jgi:hypothetical protein